MRAAFVFGLPYQYCGSQVVEKASKEINCASKCGREEQKANGQPKEPTNTLKLAFSFSHARTSCIRMRVCEQKRVRELHQVGLETAFRPVLCSAQFTLAPPLESPPQRGINWQTTTYAS